MINPDHPPIDEDDRSDDASLGEAPKEERRPLSVRRRSASRLAAVQTLFQVWASERPATEVVPSFRNHFLPTLLTDFDIDRIDEDHYTSVVFTVLDRREDIDAMIMPLLKDGWTMDRLSEVDRSALRAACIELQSLAHVPVRTVMNEYTAIAETCGGDYAFVNAVLDRLSRDLRKAEMDAG